MSDKGMTHGVDACISSWNRMEPNTFPSFAKAGGNYLSAQLMKMEAIKNGYDEAIAHQRRVVGIARQRSMATEGTESTE